MQPELWLSVGRNATRMRHRRAASCIDKSALVAALFATPLIAIGHGELLDDRAAGRVDVHAGWIAVAMSSRGMAADLIGLPIDAKGANWSALGH
jgi:hypothetical protein